MVFFILLDFTLAVSHSDTSIIFYNRRTLCGSSMRRNSVFVAGAAVLAMASVKITDGAGGAAAADNAYKISIINYMNGISKLLKMMLYRA